MLKPHQPNSPILLSPPILSFHQSRLKCKRLKEKNQRLCLKSAAILTHKYFKWIKLHFTIAAKMHEVCTARSFNQALRTAFAQFWINFSVKTSVLASCVNWNTQIETNWVKYIKEASYKQHSMTKNHLHLLRMVFVQSVLLTRPISSIAMSPAKPLPVVAITEICKETHSLNIFTEPTKS